MQRYVELKIVVKFTPRARRDSMHDYYYVSLHLHIRNELSYAQFSPSREFRVIKISLRVNFQCCVFSSYVYVRSAQNTDKLVH